MSRGGGSNAASFMDAIFWTLLLGEALVENYYLLANFFGGGVAKLLEEEFKHHEENLTKNSM